MVEAGRKYEFPDGSIYEVIVPAAQSGGARTETRITLPPSPVTPPAHLHPRQEERYTVESGQLDVQLDGQWRPLAAGESVRVQPGQVHTFRNRSGANVQFVSVHTPALSFERYLERLYWLMAMNRVRNTRQLSSLLYLSLLWSEHRDDQVLAGAFSRAAVSALGSVARLLRFKLDR
jgi:mannose-6-phosphate isomerase-like protein (cupin superfamily)